MAQSTTKLASLSAAAFWWQRNSCARVYEGKDSYPSMEAAFQDLEAGIKAYLDQWGI